MQTGIKQVGCFGVLALILGTASAQDNNTLRIGLAYVMPHASSSNATGPFLLQPSSGIAVDVKEASTLTLSYSRRLNEHWDVELVLGAPPTHDITAKLDPAVVPAGYVSAFQGQTIAKVRQNSPTLLANYSFGEPGDRWRPFVGIGVNYTMFDKRTSTAAGNALNGGPTDIHLSDSWGLAAQAGADYKLSDHWSLHGTVGVTQVKTTITTLTAGATRTIKLSMQPVVLMVSAGYRF